MGYGILAKWFPPQKQALTVESDTIPGADDVQDSEYRELARQAGWDGVEHALAQKTITDRTTQLRRFLAENGICVYDARAVNRYMKSITPAGKMWSWYDVKRSEYVERAYYTKPLPAAVLMTMATIREAFPNIWFQVTDIHDLPKGDPFLRCFLPGGDAFIIERWDEPGFRM